MKVALSLFALLAACAGMPSCNPLSPPSGTYTIDTVEFVPSNPGSQSAGPAPGIWIDTNTKLSGLSGGTVRSSKPYGLALDYTDSTFTFSSAEITGVKVIYDDGSIDPGASSLKLPLRIAAREHESINSVSGGRTVKSRDRVISGRIPGVIGRDEDFTLQIEGTFTKDDGSWLPFTIDQHYEIRTERGTRSAADVLKDG